MHRYMQGTREQCMYFTGGETGNIKLASMQAVGNGLLVSQFADVIVYDSAGKSEVVRRLPVHVASKLVQH